MHIFQTQIRLHTHQNLQGAKSPIVLISVIVKFSWCAVNLDHFFGTFNGYILWKKLLFTYSLLFWGFLMHFVLLNLNMYVQSYVSLKLYRSA